MQLEKIISISGKPGLFKLVSQLRNGFIIEDVTTKKKVRNILIVLVEVNNIKPKPNEKPQPVQLFMFIDFNCMWQKQ